MGKKVTKRPDARVLLLQRPRRRLFSSWNVILPVRPEKEREKKKEEKEFHDHKNKRERRGEEKKTEADATTIVRHPNWFRRFKFGSSCPPEMGPAGAKIKRRTNERAKRPWERSSTAIVAYVPMAAEKGTKIYPPSKTAQSHPRHKPKWGRSLARSRLYKPPRTGAVFITTRTRALQFVSSSQSVSLHSPFGLVSFLKPLRYQATQVYLLILSFFEPILTHNNKNGVLCFEQR